MPISPACDICGRELNEPGALVFSPPDVKGKVNKCHVCVGCYNGKSLEEIVDGLREDNPNDPD